MDHISEKLSALETLSTEELESLENSVVTEFDTLNTQELSEETVEAMTRLADAKDAIEAEKVSRGEKAEELSRLAQNATDRMKDDVADNVDDEEDSEDSTDSEAETVEDEEEEAVAFANSDEAQEVEGENVELSTEEPVTEEASAPAEEAELATEDVTPDEHVEELATKSEEAVAEVVTEEVASEETVVEDSATSELSEDTPAEAELSNDTTTESEESTVTASSDPNYSAPAENELTVQETERKKAVITASASLKNFAQDSVIPSYRALAQAFLDRRKTMSKSAGGDGERAMIASISHQDFYEEERVLSSTEDIEGNREKIEAVVASLKSNLKSEENAGGALVAAGGLYGPVDTTRDIYELGETLGRPVRDTLPSFNAESGGLRYITAPVLADLNGAVSVWTMEDDIAAVNDENLEKPCIRINAGEEITVLLDAIPLCLTFGNMGARAFPELVERHIELAMIQHARFAETRLLTRIGALSTSVTAQAELGAARDILGQVEIAAAALRSRHRLDPEAPLKAMFPEWFKNALRADMLKQMPGDGQEVAFNLVDSTVDAWFRARGINVTWFLDGETGQILGEQVEGALQTFPDNVIWYLFPEGTFLFLDGGTLDLGLVRDSTLNSTNDYKVFLETFEAVAKIGIESLRVTSAVALAGSHALGTNTLA